MWNRLWVRRLEGLGSVHGVKLRAGAVRALLDVSAHDLSNRILDLDRYFGRDAADFESILRDGENDEHRFLALEEWLRSHRRPSSPDSKRAAELVDRIASNDDILSVEQLAADAGATVRGVQRLFRRHVGASPKFVIRRARLQEAALRIERGDDASLAGLAAELGYADQAHFSRDFKRLTGKNPRAFAKSVR